MKMFIFAERTGDFGLHLHAIGLMLPFFHAAGHLPYAKSAHLYLQQMKELKDHVAENELEKFYKYFTVRRNKEKFWSGVWSDMTIEQVLMRSLKATGGLTRGRGLTETVLAKWTLSMPLCSKVCDAIEEFSEIKPSYSEQHIELRYSREKRDTQDVNKITEWLEQHNPFQRSNNLLISLSTGAVAPDYINCDKAKEVGEAVLKKTIGKNFHDIRYKRNDRVKTLAFINKTVKVHNQIAPVCSSQLFNRIICTCKSESDLKKCFEYELSQYPPALFDGDNLRKTKKSALFDFIDKKSPPTYEVPQNTTYVIDGGYLIHKVIWQFPSCYKDVFSQYVNFVMYHYGSNCKIIFDGYNSVTTKTQEQLRRTGGSSCADIEVSENSLLTIRQELFLKNSKNKDQFISFLVKKFQEVNISAKQVNGDADNEIVKAALSLRETCESVTLVGEDTDLLVLLVHFSKADKIFMLRPGKQTKSDRISEISKIQEKLGPIKNNILFLHAMTGCDTTSGLFKQGKIKAFKILENKNLQEKIALFKNDMATINDLFKIGEEFLMQIYGKTKSCKDLNDLRYVRYNALTARQGLTTNFDLAILPPTCSSAKNHILRVYLQVQYWLDNRLDPENWGWRMVNGILIPETTSDKMAPEFILNLIYCKCKTLCKTLCSCRKANVFCSNLCNFCNGNACSNIPQPTDMVSDDEDEYL